MEAEKMNAERIRKRLPDYFKALEMPWHLAASFMGAFVDDEEQPLGVVDCHARNLFHVAKALLEESRRPAPPCDHAELIEAARVALIAYLEHRGCPDVGRGLCVKCVEEVRLCEKALAALSPSTQERK